MSHVTTLPTYILLTTATCTDGNFTSNSSNNSQGDSNGNSDNNIFSAAAAARTVRFFKYVVAGPHGSGSEVV